MNLDGDMHMDDLTEPPNNWLKSPEDEKYDAMENDEEGVKLLTKDDLRKIEIIWPLDDERIAFGMKMTSPERPYEKGE